MIKYQTPNREAFETHLFDAVYEYICQEQMPIKFIWTLQISYLFTESIVESACSSLKTVYVENRRRLKAEKLKKILMNLLMLPDDDDNRTKIVQWVTKQFYDEHGDSIITNRWYKENRDIDTSKVLVRKSKGKDSVYVGGLLLLSVDT